MGDTMSGFVIAGNISGSIELAVPETAGTNKITFPARTGTVITSADTGSVTNAMLAGSIPNSKLANSAITIGTTTVALGGTISGIAPTGPAFQARASVNQGFSVNTYTKVNFATIMFDTNTCYNVGTSRFTPSVAGYYHVFASIHVYHAAYGGNYTVRCSIYKNGSLYIAGQEIGVAGTNQGNNPQIAGLIPMNGTSDYLEVYTWTNNPTQPAVQGGTPDMSYWGAYLARAL